MSAYTQRVKVGAIYTDGDQIWEVIDVNPLGHVSLRSDDRHPEPGRVAHTQLAGLGIDAFRRQFWLVRAALNEGSE